MPGKEGKRDQKAPPFVGHFLQSIKGDFLLCVLEGKKKVL